MGLHDVMRRTLKWIGLSTGAAALLLGAYLAAIQITGNFAVVLPGELYRSNQPDAARLASYKERYGIRTIVNLRGDNGNAGWYRDEVAAAEKLGLTHLNFRMSARRELSVDEARQLIAILADAPRPILIHCRSGADRTGLASVLYLSRIAKVDEDEAEKQLSIRYGHVGIPFLSPAYAMDETWEKLERALRTAG